MTKMSGAKSERCAQGEEVANPHPNPTPNPDPDPNPNPNPNPNPDPDPDPNLTLTLTLMMTRLSGANNERCDEGEVMTRVSVDECLPPLPVLVASCCQLLSPLPGNSSSDFQPLSPPL